MTEPPGAATPSPGEPVEEEIDRFVCLCEDVTTGLEASVEMGSAKRLPVQRFVDAAGTGRYPGVVIMDAVAVLDSAISIWAGRGPLTVEQRQRTEVLFRQSLRRIGYLGAGTLAASDRLRAERLEAAMLEAVSGFAQRPADAR